MKTLIIQSQRDPLLFPWLNDCVLSVQHWADQHSFDYRWYGDEIFQLVDPRLLNKAQVKTVIASDLARLAALRIGLNDYERVVWLDADFLILQPDSFRLPDQENLPEGYMLGREHWIQRTEDQPSRLKCYTKVHNAFLLFHRENSFLSFYDTHAKRLLKQVEGPIPAQFIGPKLLTALHNIIHCPVFESAGMLCPLVADELLGQNRDRPALALLKKKSLKNLAGVNLCSSLCTNSATSNTRMFRLIQLLLSTENPLL